MLAERRVKGEGCHGWEAGIRTVLVCVHQDDAHTLQAAHEASPDFSLYIAMAGATDQV